MLEVVEDQQDLQSRELFDDLVGQRPVACLPHAERLADCREYAVGIVRRGERHEGHAVREVVFGGTGHPQGDTGLADTAGTGQGQEGCVRVREQRDHLGDLAAASNQRRSRHRDAMRVSGGRYGDHGIHPGDNKFGDTITLTHRKACVNAATGSGCD